jgi:hypothetical protein
MITKKTYLNYGVLFKLLTCKKDVTNLDFVAIIDKYNNTNITAHGYYNRISNLKIKFTEIYQNLSQIKSINYFIKKISIIFYLLSEHTHNLKLK